MPGCSTSSSVTSPVWPSGLAQNGKYGADIDVHINICRAVKRIKYKNIVSARKILAHAYKFSFFFRPLAQRAPQRSHAIQQDAVGDGIHLLHIFTLHIHFARAAENIKQASLGDTTGNAFSRKDQVVQKTSKLAVAWGLRF